MVTNIDNMNGETKTLNHEQFLQTYLLNRALAHVGGLDAPYAVESGEEGWQKIQFIIAKDQKYQENKSGT